MQCASTPASREMVAVNGDRVPMEGQSAHNLLVQVQALAQRVESIDERLWQQQGRSRFFEVRLATVEKHQGLQDTGLQRYQASLAELSVTRLSELKSQQKTPLEDSLSPPKFDCVAKVEEHSALIASLSVKVDGHAQRLDSLSNVKSAVERLENLCSSLQKSVEGISLVSSSLSAVEPNRKDSADTVKQISSAEPKHCSQPVVVDSEISKPSQASAAEQPAPEAPHQPQLSRQYTLGPAYTAAVEKSQSELSRLKKDGIHVAISLDMMRTSGIITGIVDVADRDALQHSLCELAGRPPHRKRQSELVEDDQSSWSMENLGKLDILDLMKLMNHTHDGWRSPLQMPVLLLKLAGCTNNMSPFAEYLHAADKLDLVHSSGQLLLFYLSAAVFNNGTHANLKVGLQAVKRVLFAKEQQQRQFLDLYLSPLNGITLPETARVQAAIPVEAKFYSFCHPVLTGLDMRAKLNELDVDQTDPFIRLLTAGAFVYFDHKYDIVAVNSLCFDVVEDSTSVLYYSVPSEMPVMSVNHLTECQRWWPISIESIVEQGFTEFAWVLPSEILGDHIFTQSGGFAYKHVDYRRSRFYPIARKRIWPAGDVQALIEEVRAVSQINPIAPLPYDSPLHIEELDESSNNVNEKFVSDSVPSVATFATDKQVAALGIEAAIGISYGRETPEKELLMMRAEVKDSVERDYEGAKPIDISNLEYVLDEVASCEEVMGNDGHVTKRDEGHDGMRLADFCKHEMARKSDLTVAEVAALRLYTTSTFHLINKPLRRQVKPVPLPTTTRLIYSALKKMRAIHMSSQKAFRRIYLWRGLKNVTVDEAFLRLGGTEMACMSTSPNMRVVAGYAKSEEPLLFRVLVDSPMEMGADIQWLSVFPGEEEVLYPPLTYLKVFCKQSIRGMPKGMVITVRPSFPS